MREDYITLLHKNPLLKNYFKKIFNFPQDYVIFLCKAIRFLQIIHSVELPFKIHNCLIVSLVRLLLVC